MRATTPEQRKVKYSNTPMDESMFDWVNNKAWKLKTDRASYIRSLIRREMDIDQAWEEYQEGNND